MKKTFYIVFIFCLLSYGVMAEAAYVLPYPSYMPGNTLYKISRLYDRLKTFWSFGSITQLKNHRSLSDKYLVESKTLFEYKQYELAVNALARSSDELEHLPAIFQSIAKEKKNISLIGAVTKEDLNVQIQLLNQLKDVLPAEYSWEPEKKQATVLEIRKEIENAISVRQGVADRIP